LEVEIETMYCYSCGTKLLMISDLTIYKSDDEPQPIALNLTWGKERIKTLHYVVCPHCRILLAFCAGPRGDGVFRFLGHLTKDFYAKLVKTKLAEGG